MRMALFVLINEDIINEDNNSQIWLLLHHLLMFFFSAVEDLTEEGLNASSDRLNQTFTVLLMILGNLTMFVYCRFSI